MFPDVKRVTLAIHLFLVAGLRLDEAFFMVDLNLQARVVLEFLLFPHMIPSVPYGLVIGRASERQCPCLRGESDAQN